MVLSYSPKDLYWDVRLELDRAADPQRVIEKYKRLQFFRFANDSIITSSAYKIYLKLKEVVDRYARRMEFPNDAFAINLYILKDYSAKNFYSITDVDKFNIPAIHKTYNDHRQIHIDKRNYEDRRDSRQITGNVIVVKKEITSNDIKSLRGEVHG